MKKLAFTFVVLGSGLTAFGLSGWEAIGRPGFTIAGAPGFAWDFTAGFGSLLSQLEFTLGVMLLVCGLLLRRDQRPNAP
jgi:hypothetical protein